VSVGLPDQASTWNPIAPYEGSTPLKELFPGSRHADRLALDGYNWGATCDWGWQTYADVFAADIRRSVKAVDQLSLADPDPRS
jgi:hypothetical protein